MSLAVPDDHWTWGSYLAVVWRAALCSRALSLCGHDSAEQVGLLETAESSSLGLDGRPIIGVACPAPAAQRTHGAGLNIPTTGPLFRGGGRTRVSPVVM